MLEDHLRDLNQSLGLENEGLRARIAALEDERNSLRLTLGLMCIEAEELRNRDSRQKAATEKQMGALAP